LKERLSRVDDKPEGDAESAGGGVEDDVVAEAWRRDEEAATSQCSGQRWWQLPVAVSPSLSVGLGLGRWGTVTAGEPGYKASNPHLHFTL